MRKGLIQAIGAASLCAAVLCSIAHAQPPCPEGATRGGQCVEPSLAARARETAVVLAQPKISATAYPVLPSGDAGYRYPNQLAATPPHVTTAGVPLPPPPPPSPVDGGNPTGAAGGK